MAHPAVSSSISRKCAKRLHSVIEGGGLHAKVGLNAGQVVAVKGGHLIDEAILTDRAEVTGSPSAVRSLMGWIG